MTRLPSRYTEMSDDDVVAAIRRAKETLGDRLTILGHHYQRDQVIQFADFRGDSLGLSKRAAETDAEYIVFCGVYFMAETAAILSKPEQVVIQPEIDALCPMAQMADGAAVRQAWNALWEFYDGDLLPLTYQNSIAAVKAFVGKHGGAVCTSSNAARLLEWGLQRRDHILFIPDQHLGINTALALGVSPQEIGVWDPPEGSDPPDPSRFAGSRIIVWHGYCYVHTGFRPEDIDAARRMAPDSLVVVHPECSREVVGKADQAGSTTGIIKFVREAPVGSTIYVGTECNLVRRLDREFPDRKVIPLAERYCATMNMTTMRHLLYCLEAILAGRPHNVVRVEPEVAGWARLALERMLRAS